MDRMNKKIILLVLAFFSMSVIVCAQKLNVPSFDAEKNATIDLVIMNEASHNATAIQLMLTLPEGFVLNKDAVRKGDAIVNHDYKLISLKNNNFLILLYSMSGEKLADGTLLHIPVTVEDTEGVYQCSVSNARSADANAVGHDVEPVYFLVNVQVTTGVDSEKRLADSDYVHDLQGKRVVSLTRLGKIYIINGVKYLYVK